MKKKTISIGCLCVLVLLASCTKDPDTVYPNIQILLPNAGEKFDIPGKIPVAATISDNQAIEWISVVLTDQDHKPVLPVHDFYPENNRADLNTDYDLDDLSLGSGNYELRITAYDGVLTSNAYVPVVIRGIPRELDRIVVLTGAEEHLNVWSQQSGSREWMFDVSGDYASSVISSLYQQLYVTGNYQWSMVCYDLADTLPVWEVMPTTNPPYHHPFHLFHGNQRVYISFRQGFIRGYDYAGIIKFATPFSDHYEPAALIEHVNYMIADVKEKSGHDRYIVCYHLSSGDERFRVKTGMEVVDFYSLDHDCVYALGNIGNAGTIFIYNAATNHLRSPLPFPLERILSSQAIDKGRLLIAADSNVYLYQYQENSLVRFLPGVSAHTVEYDDLNRQFYLVTGHTITAYTFQSPVPSGSWEFEEPVRAMHLLYNK